MVHLLLAIIYLSFISLRLPDALLGAAWPNMYWCVSGRYYYCTVKEASKK